MGLFMAGPALILVAMSGVVSSLLPEGVRGVVLFIAVILVIYTGMMGTVGALVGGYLARKEPKPEQVPGHDA